MPPNDLKKVLVTRTIETAMDKIIVPLRMDQAIENRDGMAKVSKVLRNHDDINLVL